MLYLFSAAQNNWRCTERNAGHGSQDCELHGWFCDLEVLLLWYAPDLFALVLHYHHSRSLFRCKAVGWVTHPAALLLPCAILTHCFRTPIAKAVSFCCRSSYTPFPASIVCVTKLHAFTIVGRAEIINNQGPGARAELPPNKAGSALQLLTAFRAYENQYV